MSWRPEDWPKIIEKDSLGSGSREYDYAFWAGVEHGADAMVEAVSGEIEKVGYTALDIDPDHATFAEGFAWAKHEILSLLRKKSSN